MVRAAATGAVDFAAADPLDRRWWARLRIILDELAGQARFELNRLYHGRGRSLLALEGLGQQSLQSIQESLEAYEKEIEGILTPWRRAPKRDREAAVAKLRQEWVETWGDPESPETAESIAATVAFLEAQRVSTGE